MSYLVTLHRKAERALEKLPKREAERIVGAIKQMESEPMAGDVLRLAGTGRPLWRRRIGDYRLIFSVSHDRNLVIVEDIVRRTSQAYERLP
ncbi:MAG: type II toxin-antitoxin system RelE/ParE family toxin [Dehalococcoidia bacterium]|nr:type II toxin-antitoxin system RelE/ParE family toxin [Dehalococcoidia bacterium]